MALNSIREEEKVNNLLGGSSEGIGVLPRAEQMVFDWYLHILAIVRTSVCLGQFLNCVNLSLYIYMHQLRNADLVLIRIAIARSFLAKPWPRDFPVFAALPK